MFDEGFGFTSIPPLRIRYNVGGTLDLIAGEYVTGIHGESILNGGHSPLVALVGGANSNKSTLSHAITFTAADRIFASGLKTLVESYDTEMTAELSRFIHLALRYPHLKEHIHEDSQYFTLTDRTLHPGNEWLEKLKTFIEEQKIKKIKKMMLPTPFLNRKGELMTTLAPTFGELDSLSEFVTEDGLKTMDENELGEGGANALYMRQGLIKARLLSELPSICNRGAHYLVMTAHVGPTGGMQQGPPGTKPPKALSHMRADEKIKGVGSRFFFLPNMVLQLKNSRPLNNQSTKGPEYPRSSTDDEVGSSDLTEVTVCSIRMKSGTTGGLFPLVFSQRDGFLHGLTEFHFIKETMKRFGLSGNNTHYHLDLLPDVNINRKTVRGIIETNPEFARALNITSELAQIHLKWPSPDILKVTPEVMYETLKKKYDWKVLLKTRGWWTFENDKSGDPFLSTMDLINMVNDRYVPFWLK